MKSTAVKQPPAAIEARGGWDAPHLTLDARGMIRYCSPAAAALFKYRRSDLIWQHVSMLLPQLAEEELVHDGELNPRLRFLFHTGRYFDARTRNGETFPGDIFLNILDDTGGGRLSLIVRPAEEIAGSA